MTEDTGVYEAADGPNEWERRMLYLAEADSVLAACTAAAVESMRWTCEVAGHPKQDATFDRCICETWAGHMLAGAVVIECEDNPVNQPMSNPDGTWSPAIPEPLWVKRGPWWRFWRRHVPMCVTCGGDPDARTFDTRAEYDAHWLQEHADG